MTTDKLEPAVEQEPKRGQFDMIQCQRCRTTTKHQYADDAWWCVRCWKAGVYEEPQPADESDRGGGLMIGTIKLAAFLVAIVVLLGFATCVAPVCVVALSGSGHH